jgi:hypothetical protein
MSLQSYSCIGYTLHSFAPNITLKILNFCKSVILLPSMLSFRSSCIYYTLRHEAPNIRLALSYFFKSGILHVEYNYTLNVSRETFLKN